MAPFQGKIRDLKLVIKLYRGINIMYQLPEEPIYKGTK